MALVRTNKAGAGNTTALANYPTSSFSVTAGDLLIAVFSHNQSGTAGTHTIGGTGTTLTGITWTQITTVPWATSNVDRMTAWYGVCASTSTGVLTFICPTAAGAGWSVFSYTGHDTAGPVSAAVSTVSAAATIGPLDVSALTGALTVWAAARNTNATGATHPGAATIHDVTHASPTRNYVTMSEAGENAPTVAWGAAWNGVMLAFKVRVAAAAGPALPDVVVSGAKKTVAAANVVVGGAKKPVVGLSVVVAGVKKPVV